MEAGTEFLAGWQSWRRDRDTELRDMFGGSCPAFPPGERWVVTAEYRPYPRPRPESVATAGGGTRTVRVHGRLLFSLGGAECCLEPYSSGPPGRLNVAFTDATSGDSTYPLGRVVFPPLPAPGQSRVVIDFNRAVNPPCAFTPYAWCALPPPGNRLPVLVEAGEKLPPGTGGNPR
jgi:uncharacterized protein